MWWILGFLGVAALIALVVWLLRRYIPGLTDNEVEDPDKISRDNIERLIVTPSESQQEELEEENPEED